MSVAQIFENLESARLTAQAESWRAYKDLLADLANGDSVDPGEALTVLAMVHKSQKELEADLATYRRRLAWVTEMERGPAAIKEMAEAERELAAANARAAEAIGKLNAEIAAAESRVRAAQFIVIAANSAELQLQSTCVDPVIQEKENQIMKAKRPLLERKRVIEDSIAPYRRNVKSLGNLQERLRGAKADTREELNSEIRRSEAIVKSEKNALANGESQLQGIAKELAELDRQGAELAGEKRKA